MPKKSHLFKRKDLKNDEDKVKKNFKDLLFSASRILESENKLRIKVLNYKNSKFFP